MSPETVNVTLSLPAGLLVAQLPQPELISQRNVEATLGVPKRAYLEALAGFRAAGGQVLTLGRLRLVRRADFVSWLGRREQAAPEADGADALAAELGLRAVAGGRP